MSPTPPQPYQNPPQPYQNPAATQNPILDEINRLSPQAKAALQQAHQQIASIPDAPGMPAAPMAPAAVPGAEAPRLALPSRIPVRGLGNPVAEPAPMTPDQTAHVGELNRLESTGSGVSQLIHGNHNPLLKGLGVAADVVASGLFPKFGAEIPGTTAHHMALTSSAERAVQSDEAQRGEQAKEAEEAAQTGHLQAGIPLEGAQTEATQAEIPLRQAQAEGEQAKTAALPETMATDTRLKNAQADKAEADAYLAKNPQAKSAFDLWQKQNPNGKAEDFLKLQSENKTGNDFEQFYKDYLTEHGTPDSAHARMQARTAWAAASQAPQRAPQVTVFVPSQDGGYTAQAIHPGQNVAPGAVSASGMNSLNVPTTQQRNVEAQAALVHEQTPSVLADIDRMKDQIGPLSGRWNEFMQGKVGANNPDMASLRSDLLMYSSAVALMHARGRLPENLREEFDHAINAPNQTAANLTATIKKVDEWTAKNMSVMSGARGVHDQAQPSAGGSESDPLGILGGNK